MTIQTGLQAQQVDATYAVINYLNSAVIEKDKGVVINDVDSEIVNLAKDILDRTTVLGNEDILVALDRLEEYTGSPDLLCPKAERGCIAALRTLIKHYE